MSVSEIEKRAGEPAPARANPRSGRLRLVGAGGRRLAWIHRWGLGRQRLAVSVEQLDFGRVVKLENGVLLRLLGDVASGLVLDLLEGGEALGAYALDLDDVPAELRLDRIGDLAFLQFEGGLGEFRHHAVLS